jgi:hypothetical protein
MGRHSRGAGEAPEPLPDPPARHPYAPRSVEDTGGQDRGTYLVVDVGLPEGAPGSEPSGLRSVRELGTGPSRFGPGESATRLDPEPPRYGATRADLAAPGLSPTQSGFRPHTDPADTRFGAPVEQRSGATRADLAWSRFGGSAEPGLGAPESRFDGPAEAGFGGPAEQRFGAPAEPRFGATRADLAQSRFGGPAGSRVGAPESRFGGPAESRFGGPADSRLGPPVQSGSGAPTESRFGGPAESRFGAARADLAEPRFGATRADLYQGPVDPEDGPAPRYGAESVGSIALAPRPAPDPDEVTDTGARRARSAFRLATETATEETHEDHEDDYETEHEPSLLLQWGIFVAQTLTGAVAGLGVWLGFYRLWSTWPFYAVPAVGVAAIGMLVIARTLRRRHGHDLDLLTAAVTVGISTVLTVLPAAFTLQNLA